MTDVRFNQQESPTTSAQLSPEQGKTPSAKEEAVDTVRFLVILGLTVLIFRSFFLSPFNIPSESMQPRLLIGDYLLVNKMAYGYSKHSLPFSPPIITGRVFARTPERGDVAVFKAPPNQKNDYIKRVIGLPGDELELVDGVVWLNGKPLGRDRIDDFVIPVTQNMINASRQTGMLPCYSPEFEETAANGARQCRYPQYRETLPSGRSYPILDIATIHQDNMPPVIVPEGHLFMMGDNRDRSADSRFPAVENEGIGFVPEENLVGHALVSMFSTDGSASWINPISWFTATRWERIGEGF